MKLIYYDDTTVVSQIIEILKNVTDPEDSKIIDAMMKFEKECSGNDSSFW